MRSAARAREVPKIASNNPTSWGYLLVWLEWAPRHARELGPWTGQVFAAMGIEETREEARLRLAASLLADIGWRAHPEYRGTQALNIIANGMELFHILQNRKVPSRLVYYPDENHWILKRQNSLFWYDETKNWLARYAPAGGR